MSELVARYELATELNTFDYFGWQAQVAARGATEIVFDTRGLSDVRRFESIIAPGPALLGLPSRIGMDGEPMASSRFRHLAAFARSCTDFPRMYSILPPGSAEFTITLRQQKTKSSHRNSNVDAWRIFAAEIGALIIEDYDIAPIGLHERMALYAGARMNFAIACGPAVLCALSSYPCVSFGWGWNWGNGFLEKAGIKHNDTMPWCGPDQHTVWESDDLETIREWFAGWERLNRS